MKLLSPSAIKDTKNLELTREILRTKEINEVSEKSRKELAQAQMDFNNALADFKERWAKEEEEHDKRMVEMKAEIQVLEDKRKQALIPISIEMDKANRLLDEAKGRLSQVKEKEVENQETAEKLQDRLDEVGQREQDVKFKEKKLEFQEQGIIQQTQFIKENNQKLSKQLSDFLSYKNAIEKDIDERKTALVLWDRTLQNKEEVLKRTDKAQKEVGVRLKEERINLDKAWKELKPLSP